MWCHRSSYHKWRQMNLKDVRNVKQRCLLFCLVVRTTKVHCSLTSPSHSVSVWPSEEETRVQERWGGCNLSNPGKSSCWVQAVKAEDKIRWDRQRCTDVFMAEGSGHNNRIKARESKRLISCSSTPARSGDPGRLFFNADMSVVLRQHNKGFSLGLQSSVSMVTDYKLRHNVAPDRSSDWVMSVWKSR